MIELQRSVRCAIYTRKSTIAGLDQEVNSLTTQESVCEAYIKCQEHRHWVLQPTKYSDGGYSGGSLERPGLQRLLKDVEFGQIDIIVIYKMDRLTRSLTDFVRVLDVLKQHGASFVSVTQTFDTSDSMGRLVLNILLTFAQFERELMSERVRDKKAALARKGLFTGGLPPMGYRLEGSRLVVDADRCDLVKETFARYPFERMATIIKDFEMRGLVTRIWRSKAGHVRGGRPVGYSVLKNVLRNPIYCGRMLYRGELMRAEVEPLVSFEQWQLVQRILSERAPRERDPARYLLINILFDEYGRRMVGNSRGQGRALRGRYYSSISAGWARGQGPKKLMADADRAEEMTKAGLVALLRNRAELTNAVLSGNEYSDKIVKALRRGNIAAKRVESASGLPLREIFATVLPRVDIDLAGLKLRVCIPNLIRFLRWDGSGSFQSLISGGTESSSRIYTVEVPVTLLCGKRIFSIGIEPRAQLEDRSDPYLKDLIIKAAEFHRLVIENRSVPITKLAAGQRMSTGYFNRILRLNYLAPDIQMAIIDGTQPAEVTRRTLLMDAIPLRWDQQRAALGFPPRQGPLITTPQGFREAMDS
ncbi:recombinase family protein [Sphingomonas sp. ASV193]|uniref:recombinase family protein n=1 Tax=Sphingomonas sp. ASV193 TaxID=3144405 RepID=UPI0032E8A5E7